MNDPLSNTQRFAFHIGRTVGKYKIESLLGRGGMAEVYKAKHPELGREVAIKILHPFFTDTPGFIERFRREAQAAAVLRHPHIVQIYDFDATEDGLYYMVMEYIEGQSLEDYLDAHKTALPQNEAVQLFKEIADALQYAHDSGMVHRDIKPANMLLDKNGRIYLTDFGIAQIVGASRLTESGLTTGTPYYMAPEQVAGKPVTAAADQYALGVMLYQMFTGRLPFSGENPATVMMTKLTEPPPPPSQFNPGVPLAVESVILRALELQPEARFASVQEMCQAVESAVSGTATTPIFAPPAPAPTLPAVTAPAQTIPQATVVSPIPPTPQQTPIWVWPAVVVGALALVAVGFLLARGNQPPATPTPTQESDVAIVVETETAVFTPTPSPSPSPSPSPTTTPAPVREGMVFIPAGTFTQGSANGNADEAPPHTVQLSDYFMDTTEVTNAAYAQFIAETGHPAPAHWQQPDPSIWRVQASEAYVAGRFDNQFFYDGAGVYPVSGTLSMTVNADSDEGLITAVITGSLQPTATNTYSGVFRIEQRTFFDGPPFPAFKEGGIGDFVDMHGLSGNELSAYPELVAYLGTWGFADVYLNDELLFNALGVHIMYSDGVRNDDVHFLHRADGSCCFSPAAPGDSSLDPGGPEISLWLFPGTSYEDAQELWINLYFNQVTQLQAPEFVGPPIYPEGQELYPVTNISWQDAAAFCAWRDARLPTEAEWEYAARGPQGLLYPWGDEPRAAQANIANTLAGTAPVGSFPESISPFGLLDMAGNVWEWVADWYSETYYASSAPENPLGPATGTLKVLRGGGFRILDILGLDEARTTHRLPLDPTTLQDDIGFRCAAPIE